MKLEDIIRELEVSLQALKEENAMLRDEANEMRRWTEEAARAENLNALDAQKERTAVVAWLRDGVSSAILYRADDVSMDSASAGVAMLLAHVANAIERGEHRREEEK